MCATTIPVRIWCGTPELVQTTNKAQVSDLGLNYGAGDGNRTRALSLGIDESGLEDIPSPAFCLPRSVFAGAMRR
ncbi:hypothetical protein T261_4339 [Streptomyces lydicus]|nr:hypothetical protein T261_4339 [Streptomyces lydicus]